MSITVIFRPLGLEISVIIHGLGLLFPTPANFPALSQSDCSTAVVFIPEVPVSEGEFPGFVNVCFGVNIFE